ncbi:MAG: rhamnogalacturonan acetylesterase, partial [Bacillus sp. (in: firmicutes)]
VQLINLWEKTEKLYQSLGPEDSKKLFVWFHENEHPNYLNGLQVNTHFCESGAKEVGKLVIEGIKELKLPIMSYIKD